MNVSGRYLKSEQGSVFSPITSPDTVIGTKDIKLTQYIEGFLVFKGKAQGTQTLAGTDWGDCDHLLIQFLFISSGTEYYQWQRLTHTHFNKRTGVVLSSGTTIGYASLYIDAKNMFKFDNSRTFVPNASDTAENEIWVTQIIIVPPMVNDSYKTR